MPLEFWSVGASAELGADALDSMQLTDGRRSVNGAETAQTTNLSAGEPACSHDSSGLLTARCPACNNTIPAAREQLKLCTLPTLTCGFDQTLRNAECEAACHHCSAGQAAQDVAGVLRENIRLRRGHW